MKFTHHLLLLAALIGVRLAAVTPATPAPAAAETHTILASSLKLDGTGFYLDKGKWAAINPDKNKEASVTFPSLANNGRYRLTLHVVGENDGNSTFDVIINGQSLGEFTAPPSKEMFEEGAAFTRIYRDVAMNQGENITVRAKIASNDGKEWSRARWSKLTFAVQEADPGREASRLDLAAAQKAALAKVVARQPSGDGKVTIKGELRTWHKVTLDLAGPFAAENDTAPNPFTDYRLAVTFTHESGSPSYTVPGYFAADGNAANTSATAGTVWRAHLSPDKVGKWNYTVAFTQGALVALDGGGTAVAPFNGKTGSFNVTASDKTGRDFRSKGRLIYNGSHYLHHAGSGEAFYKAGADAPETLLAYTDFDDTIALKANVPLKTWSPHLNDWKNGDPTWKDGKGKALIGALNYLAGKGPNAFSFLTYNAAGDGDNIWPFVARDAKFHYDCSKLDQWGIVFDHAQKLGLFLHFKLQETENDDNILGHDKAGSVPQSLDGGDLGPERKLYLRELIARYGYQLALNWNCGEENTQSTAQQRAMAQYIHDTDAFKHLTVIHTFPNEQEKVYRPLLGDKSVFTGASLQNSWNAVHRLTVQWVRESAQAGKPWVVANDEQGSAGTGVPPDPGYQGYNNTGRDGKAVPQDLHAIRKSTLWGNIMAGGAGVEYYFGYQLPENDLICQDWRSRDQSWNYIRFALDFLSKEKIPVTKMTNADELVGNAAHDNSIYCFAQTGQLYLVYLPNGGQASLDLSAAPGDYTVSWFNPRTGGALTSGGKIKGGAKASVTAASTDDWLAVVRRN